MKMTHTGDEIARHVDKAECQPSPPTVIDELPALNENFFTRPQEGISLHWMKETEDGPVRGERFEQG